MNKENFDDLIERLQKYSEQAITNHDNWIAADLQDAICIITRLQADNIRLNEARERSNEVVFDFEYRYKNLERKYDAAIADINKSRSCKICKRYSCDDDICLDCDDYLAPQYHTAFEWRGGVKK